MDAIQAGARVWVRDRREAAELRLAYAKSQQQAGQVIWPTPRIETTEAVLRGHFVDQAEQQGLALRLLTPQEEMFLWQQATDRLLSVLAKDDLLPLETHTIARGLARAARTLGDWGLTDLPSSEGTPDTEWLLGVMTEVERTASELGALPRHRLPGWLKEVGGLTATAPGRVWRVTGPLPRAIEEVFATIAGEWPLDRLAGSAAATREPTALNATAVTPRVVVARDEETEWRLAAEWARARLIRHPDSRLRVIIPSAQANAERIRRIFTEVLTPSVCLHAGESTAFRLLIAAPVTGLAGIGHALESLQILVGGEHAGERLARWWMGGFWGESSLVWRAGLARALRERPLEAYTAQHWRRFVRDFMVASPRSVTPEAGPSVTALLDRLTAADARVADMRSMPKERTPGQWGQQFSEVLQALGIGGAPDGGLTREPALRQAWQSLLEKFAQLETVLPRCTLSPALQALSALAKHEVLDAPVGDVSVGVSASLEPSCVPCDGLWVCGLRAADWPAAPISDGYLPRHWLRSAGVPEVAAAGQGETAARQLAGWRLTTAELVLSWAVVDEEALHLPSPLLRPWLPPLAPEQDPAQAWRRLAIEAGPALAAQRWQQRPTLERYPDTQGLPWTAARALRGGAWALVDQQRCPFSAYARRRIGSGDAEEPALGIDARLRGQWVHQAMHAVWSKIKTQQTLIALDDARLRGVIEAALAEVEFDSLAGLAQSRLQERLTGRERQRLHKLLWDALQLDRTRPEAFEVWLSEHPLRLQIGGATLDLRLDRVDRMADDSWLVIDYKTGQGVNPKWSGTHFDAVQLWLYAAAVRAQNPTGPLAGLANLSLRSAAVRYRGLVSTKDRLPAADTSDDLAAVEADAQRQLEALARDFLAGEARVAPRKNACDRCELPLLCRKSVVLATALGQGDDDA